VVQAETALVGFDVFNVGDTKENYTKQMIVDEILRQIPSAVVEKVSRAEDPRDYRVNFDKIRNRIGFKITKRLSDGVREVREILEHGMLLNPYDARYSNV
jgi:nucleoside-diphosphate-sugar epimerase